jgi:hypothetical protein
MTIWATAPTLSWLTPQRGHFSVLRMSKNLSLVYEKTGGKRSRELLPSRAGLGPRKADLSQAHANWSVT